MTEFSLYFIHIILLFISIEFMTELSSFMNFVIVLLDWACLTLSLKINYLSIGWELEAKLRVC